MRRTVTALAMVGVLMLLAVTQVQAHTLTMRGAERVADRAVSRIVNEFPSSERARGYVATCRRRSVHVVNCRAVFIFPTSRMRCVRTVSVSFSTHRSRVARVRYPRDTRCTST